MSVLGERVRAIASKVAKNQSPTPLHTLLSAPRQTALDETLRTFQPRAAQLEPGLRAHDPDAPRALNRLADDALQAFRDRVDELAEHDPWLKRAAALDAYWRGPTEREHMDDPAFPEHKRTRIIEALDRFNHTLGSYELFLGALRPLLAIRGPTRILDLAAGHGGFALALARLSREQGLNLEITASDLKREYLDVGEARARREGLDVQFRVQDALHLQNLSEDPPDLVICTQAIHHFPAGLVTCMFDEAARIARRGVVFIDGVRNMLHAPVVSAYGVMIARAPGFAHDGVISLRRFFAREELSLLGNLVPRQNKSEAIWTRPSHLALRYTR